MVAILIDTSKAFSGFSTDDLDASEAFYRDKLGVKVTRDDMGILALNLAEDKVVMVYPKPNHEAATFTVLNFPTDDIDAAVDELAGKGITFERYEGIEADEKGIARDPNGPAIAWFKDNAGNILSVLSRN